MKLKWMMAVAGFATALSAVAADDGRAVLKTQKEIDSYAMGVMTARNFQKNSMEVDLDVMMRGLKDGMARGQLLIPEKELRLVMRNIMAEARKAMIKNRRQEADINRREGAKYLAENGKKKGVVTLPSGVQYSVIKRGTGKLPTDSDIVVVNYRGSLLNGREFDASEPGKPARLKLSSLISGWKDAVKLMPVGSHWKIVVPASAGYGGRGVGSEIGPNATLLFDVELVGLAR